MHQGGRCYEVHVPFVELDKNYKKTPGHLGILWFYNGSKEIVYGHLAWLANEFEYHALRNYQK